MRHNLKSSVTLINFCLVIGIFIVLACKCSSENNVNKEVLPGKNEVTTTVILVRHAEKSNEPEADPHLTREGFDRANLLKDLLLSKNVATIYTSKYRRAKETAKPLADELGITPIEINEAETIAQLILRNNPGQTVLIVGHTNTIPDIIKNLGGEQIEAISEADFGNIFTVTLTPGEPVKVVKTKY